MITGRLDMQFATIAPTLSNIQGGKLRALVTTGAQRSAALPDVPTVAEAAMPGYEAVLWVALVMPPATPAAIIARLNRELNDILKTADAREALIAQGLEPEPGPPEAVTQRIRTDIDKWRGVVAKAGIKAGVRRPLALAPPRSLSMLASLTRRGGRLAPMLIHRNIR